MSSAMLRMARVVRLLLLVACVVTAMTAVTAIDDQSWSELERLDACSSLDDPAAADTCPHPTTQLPIPGGMTNECRPAEPRRGSPRIPLDGWEEAELCDPAWNA